MAVPDDDDEVVLDECGEALTTPSYLRQTQHQHDMQLQITTERLNNLTMEERSQAVLDLHGVNNSSSGPTADSSTSYRTAAMLKNSDIMNTASTSSHIDDHHQDEVLSMEEITALEQMDTTLRDLASKCKMTGEKRHPALDLALTTNPNYVKEIRLAYLRKEENLGDAYTASERLAQFLDLKLEYFGSECVTRHLTVDDLPKEDYDAWYKTGFIQLLRESDRAGRGILMMDGKIHKIISFETSIRVSMVLSTIITRDVTLSKNGVITVYYGIGVQNFRQRSPLVFFRAWRCLPMKVCGRHMLYNNPILHRLLRASLYVMELTYASRFRGHFGTHQECIFNMMTFGVPNDVWPFERRSGSTDPNDVQVTLDDHQAMLYTFKARTGKQSIVVADTDIDRADDDNDDDEIEPLPLTKQTTMELFSETPTNILDETAKTLASMRSSILNGSMATTAAAAATTDDVTVPVNVDKNIHQSQSIIGSPNSTTTSLLDNAVLDGPNDSRLVLVPTSLDILMGRGRHGKKANTGNLRFHSLLEEYSDQYESSDRYEKSVLSTFLLQELQTAGCRFLKPVTTSSSGTTSSSENNVTKKGSAGSGGVWVVVDDEAVREKITHAFRNIRQQKQKQVKQQQKQQKQPPKEEDETITGSKRERS